MTDFGRDVQRIVGPLLHELGYVFDEVSDESDEGNRPRTVVYYRSDDTKIQVYESVRDGEVNCMIAPVGVPNEFGVRADKWQFPTRFLKHPDVPLEELVKLSFAELESYADPLEWVRDRIARSHAAARAGILGMYPNT